MNKQIKPHVAKAMRGKQMSRILFLVIITVILLIPKEKIAACWLVLPDIDSITPAVAYPDQIVTIRGAVFQWPDLILYYGNETAGWKPLAATASQSVTETTITFRAPRYVVANSKLYVHTCGGSSSEPKPFAVTIPTNRISSATTGMLAKLRQTLWFFSL